MGGSRHFPFPQLHMRKVPSLDVETTFIPLSTIAVSVTAAVCPVSVTGHEPSSADQILIRISDPELNTTMPEGKSLSCICHQNGQQGFFLLLLC